MLVIVLDVLIVCLLPLTPLLCFAIRAPEEGVLPENWVYFILYNGLVGAATTIGSWIRMYGLFSVITEKKSDLSRTVTSDTEPSSNIYLLSIVSRLPKNKTKYFIAFNLAGFLCLACFIVPSFIIGAENLHKF